MRPNVHSFSQVEVPVGFPKVIPGCPLPSNMEAIDWGPHGCVAYATGTTITVMDPQSGRIIQTLDGHKGVVTKVKWGLGSMSSLPHGLNFIWRLASGDVSGTIIVWDVKEGRSVSIYHENPAYQKQVMQLHWHPEWHSYLMCLQQPSVMTVWNVRTNERVWRCEIGENCFDFEINPFDTSSMALAAEGGWVYFAKNFSKNSGPSSIERKYRVQSSIGNTSSQEEAARKASIAKQGALRGLTQRIGELGIPMTNTPARETPPVGRIKNKIDMIQLRYSPHFKDIIFFVLSREVLIFDLRIEQPVGNIVLDRARGMFTFIVTCPTLAEFLFFLHDDGLISAWKPRNRNSFQYDYITSSDYFKVGKQVLPKSATLGMPPMIGISSSPFSETSFVLLSNDGRVHTVKFAEAPTQPNLPFSSPETTRFERGDNAGIYDGRRSSEKANRSSPWRFTLVASGQSLIAPTSCIQTTFFSGNSPSKMAVGSRFGALQIVNVVTNEVEFEYEIFNEKIRQVAWLNSNKVLLFAYTETDKRFNNMMWIVDVRNGSKQKMRPTTSLEASPIVKFKLSHSKQLAIVYLRDKPIEIWDLQTGELIHMISSLSNIVTFEWISNNPDIPIDTTKSIKERFVVSAQGTLHFFSIEHGSVTQLKFSFDGNARANCIAWRENYLITSDETNIITVWDAMKGQKSQTIPLRSGNVQRIKFCPVSKQPTLLVQHGECDISVVYVDTPGKIFTQSWSRDFFIADIDWAWGCHPAVALSDGGIRILDSSLRCNSAIRPSWTCYPLITPALLSPKQALGLKAYLQHDCKRIEQDESENSFEHLVTLVDEKITKSLKKEGLTIPERCKKIAEFYGDMKEYRFWSLVIYYIKVFKDYKVGIAPSPEIEGSNIPASLLAESVVHSERLLSPTRQSFYESSISISGPPLPGCYSHLRDKQTVYTEGLAIADIHSTKRANYKLTKQCVHQNIILGKFDRSIQMLMETQGDNPQFLNDMLKACVISGGISSESFENTVRLVATNLIASNMLDEGIELLALLGKSGDACRYLEMNERWEDSAFLGKISLPESQSSDIFRRWAREIWQANPYKASMLCVSVGDFYEAITILLSTRFYDIAAQLANSCLESGLVSNDEGPLSGAVSFFVRPSVLGAYAPKSKLTGGTLIQCTMARYSETLHQLDYLDMAAHYRQLGGTVESDAANRDEATAGQESGETAAKIAESDDREAIIIIISGSSSSSSSTVTPA